MFGWGIEGVKLMGRSIIKGEILGGSFDGQMHLISRIEMSSNEDDLFYIKDARIYRVSKAKEAAAWSVKSFLL